MPRAGQMTEKELQTSLVRALRTFGWVDYEAWKSMHSPRGWPDIFARRDLNVIVWELKNATSKPTPEQIEWLNWWSSFAISVHPAARVHVALVRPADLEEAYKLIGGLQGPSTLARWTPVPIL